MIMKWYEKLEMVRQYLDDDTIIAEFGNYFTSDQMNDAIDFIIHEYSLDDAIDEDEDSE